MNATGWTDDQIDFLLAECLVHPAAERRNRLEAACAAHPAEASEMRRRFERLEALGILDLPAAEAGGEEPKTHGHFRLLRRLGAGSMGVVHLADDVVHGRQVALKILWPGFEASEQAQSRFHVEMEAAGRLRHPSIAAIHEVGVIDGLPFIAMEYVEGESLAEWIGKQRARRTRSEPAAEERERIEQVCAWGEQLADALHHTHEAGVVHRDVKPSNILIAADDGRAVLLDFGLAHAMDSAEARRLTTSGEVLGTPAYMAPEQIAGRDVGPFTDVHALGLVLFECLTLEHPYQQTTREAMFRAILECEPPLISKLEPAVPSELELVLATALARSPAHRYGSASVLAQELRRIRAREPIVTRRPGVPRRLWRSLQRHRSSSSAVVLGMVAVVFLVFWVRSARSAGVGITADTEVPGGVPEVLAERADHLWSLPGDAPGLGEPFGFAPGDQFGFAVAVIDDLNGDGCAEVAVGAPGEVFPNFRPSMRPGSVGIFSGRDGGLLHREDGGRNGDWFGFDVAAAGDVDGDGTGDLVIGARQGGKGHDERGYVRVLSGRDFGELWSVPGGAARDRFGFAVAAAGDVDRDGCDDVAVGAPNAKPGGNLYGQVSVLSGRTSESIWELPGGTDREQFGTAVRGLGDVNGDGWPDLAIGAAFADPDGIVNLGMVQVVSGRDGAELYRLKGLVSKGHFGMELAVVDDVDGDGCRELLVGAPSYNKDVFGRVVLYSGADGELLQAWDDAGRGDAFGEVVTATGDMNGDGTPDILIGGRWHAPNGRKRAGAAYLFSGVDGSPLRSWFGEHPMDMLGCGVAGGGDVNGDGAPDLILGMRGAGGTGRVSVFAGGR